MPFAEDNDMIKTVPPDRTDEPLRIPVLPRRRLIGLEERADARRLEVGRGVGAAAVGPITLHARMSFRTTRPCEARGCLAMVETFP